MASKTTSKTPVTKTTVSTKASKAELVEVEEVNQIDAALSRIERNEFGLCIDCGQNIAEKRLLHSPFSARCIVCQEELENMSHQ